MQEVIFHKKKNGKFLLTGEYLILKGALGLAIPLCLGQEIIVNEDNTSYSNVLNWKSKELGSTYLDLKIQKSDLKVIHSTNSEIEINLEKILQQIRNQNPQFLNSELDTTIEVNADFNLQWGLGSSSTLLAGLADFAQVDEYILLENTFGGSGYDLACANSDLPIIYQLEKNQKVIREVKFNPTFSENIFFVYLGKKMNSRAGMSYFKEKAVYGLTEIQRISELTNLMIETQDYSIFEEIVLEHEEIMSQILQTPTVYAQQFFDYTLGVMKSMGAWGGDFILVTATDELECKKYFQSKGLDTVIPFKEFTK